MKIYALDLFCGIGGLTYGIQNAGINVIAGFDFEESCKFAYETNNNSKFIHKDIKLLESGELESYYPQDTDVKVLVG